MRNITAAIIGIAFIIGLFILGKAYNYKSKSTETITVTGSADKDFISDLIVWSGSYSRKSMDLKSAYVQLKDDENTIRAYLTGKGIQNNEMIFSSVDINKEFTEKWVKTGNRLARNLQVIILLKM